MRTRSALVGALLAAGLVLAAILRGNPAGERLAGTFLLVAAIVALTLLPWGRIMPGWAPMDLFQPPAAGERWCSGCGRPAPASAPCPTCGKGSQKPASK